MTLGLDAPEAPPKVKEIDLQRQLVGTKPPGLAIILGWESVHFRPAMTTRGWRTPGSGSMAKGWPDLTLVRGARLIWAELKSDAGRVDPDQERVLELLRNLECDHLHGPKIEVYVWRPKDFEQIAEILR